MNEDRQATQAKTPNTEQAAEPTAQRSQMTAQIEWDENGQPISSQFDDVYFSKVSGIEETRYVFLQANHLPDRWRGNTSLFTIGETGFGTGLNFLCAWQLFRQTKTAQQTATTAQHLHFCSVEKYPLSRANLTKALALWPELAEFSSQLIEQYPPQPARGMHRLIFDEGRVVLTLFFGEASAGFNQWLEIVNPGPHVASLNCAIGEQPGRVDAWFLDGFAPSKNPDMWTDALFSNIAKLSACDATFATFTAAGKVRRALQSYGFDCRKIPGFGRKREMLSGIRADENTPEQNSGKPNNEPENTDNARDRHQHRIAPGKDASWHLTRTSDAPPVKNVVVIGGGLAGCHAAFALAKRNINVTVIERHGELACEGSGNGQGAVYAKLSPHTDPLSEFNLAAQVFANNFYAANGFYAQCGEQCGVLHLAGSEREHALYQEFANAIAPSFARWVSKEQTEDTTGLALNRGGLWLPQAGWLSPKNLCQALLAHPATHQRVHVRNHESIEQLNFEQGVWQLVAKSTQNESAKILQADAVVVASAYDAQTLLPSGHLPLKRIRGQVSQLPQLTSTQALRAVICGEGYIAPATNSATLPTGETLHHTIGATFTLKNFDLAPTLGDHQLNLQKLGQSCDAIAAELQTIDPQSLAGRAAFRCTTPDYFPIVGPVADVAPFAETFTKLRRNANTIVDEPGNYHPRLYCSVGYGSRGLCYTPLCSELLASLIAGELLPLPRALVQHLHPGRFVVRDLMRRKL